ncbi:NAD(P)/FAD-dependent oxidoreductase [Sulfoacidibacillus thermotolerans]|uniref:Sulfide-quinone oxidoreductase n=1 Tax=Sulfoacidibacillus thermotolerans TaxID=1765684 RepID=A0A2U3D9Y3_SULT2|nr:FAD-dependent oxidoreductase [Sulfoacidibacillus thermotolerans]PWI58081.1 sulfide-quinone oxidoreductase [Sulfoacidibacillus thermotolerans]
MKHIVIVGAGFGGLTVFYHLATWASARDVQMTVIDERETFLLKPSLPEVALGEKDIRDVTFALRPVIENYGRFIRSRVLKIDPKEQIVYLEDETRITYDFLIIALGGKKDFSVVPGFDRYGYSVCTDILAPRMWEAIEKFEKGNILIGSGPMLSGTRLKDVPHLETACEGPVGEVAFMIDSELRKRGTRDQSRIICFSPAEIFFEDVGDKVHEAFEQLARKHEVEVMTNKVISSIEQDQIRFKDGTTISSALTILIPTYRGPDIILESGLGDEAGFVPTNEDFQHLDYDNIYAIGDVASRTVPKLGHLAVEQGNLVASILRQRITGEGSRYDYEPEVFCIMNMGHRKAMLIRSNTLWGGTMDISYHSTMSHMMKTSFDNYMVKFKGKMPPQIAQRLLNVYLGRFESR